MAKNRRKQRLAVLLAVLALVLLPGCSVLGGSVESLLRAPELTGQSGAVQRAVTSYLGGTVTFKYPASGDFLSPFLFGDWDGDGVQEAAALYRASDASNVSLAVLEPEGESGWRVIRTAEGLSGEVESVTTARLRDTESLQMLVGYGSAQGDRYLVVYDYADGALQTVISQSYTHMLLTNVTGREGIQDLVLALPNEAENAGVSLQLLTSDENGFRSAQTLSVGEGQISGCAALHSGVDYTGAAYLVVDGWSGASASSLFSCFVNYNAENGFLNTFLPGNLTDPYTQTLRYDVTLTSRDINGDGDLDIPVEISDGGVLNEPLDRSLRFLEWQDYVGRYGSNSTFGIYDSENRFFLPLPRTLRGNVRVRANVAGNGWLVCGEGNGKVYCELRVAPATDAHTDERYQQIAAIGSQQLQARMIAEYPGLTLDSIANGVLLL